MSILTYMFLIQGIAGFKSICDSWYGLGVSGGITGSLSSLEAGALYWDILVIAHELGHNFGAVHTHDFNPTVDQCGLNNCLSYDNTPISDGDATIMR